MPEPGRNGSPVLIAVLALLVPAVLGVGWLLGRLEGPPPRAVANNAAPDPRAAIARVHPARFADSPRGGTQAAPATAAEGIAKDSPDDGAKDGVLSGWTTYDEAVEQSRRNGKPVLVDFNAEWCGPCQALKRSVFDDSRRGQAVQMAVIPVSIVDRRREEGSNPADIEGLQSRYEVSAFPTVVVFSPATGRKESRRGFRDPDEMLQWIEEAARRVR